MNETTPPPPFERRDYAWLAFLAMLALFLFIRETGSYPLWDPWEPKYAQSMRETMDRGELITPYLNGKIRWTKPILIYWAMYVPMSIWGNNEFTVRLPSVLCGALGVCVLFYFLRRLRGRFTAIVGAVVLMTLPQYFYMARQAMPDMMLTMFLGATMGFFALGRFCKEYRRTHLMLFYASVGLAFLTKGPVACVITLGAIGIFWIIDFDPQRVRPRAAWADFRQMLSNYDFWRGLAVFTAISAPWYVAMLVKHRYEFVEKFIMDQNADRFTETLHSHEGITTHYLQAIFHGMYPWIGILPASIAFYFQGFSELTDEVRQRWYYLSWFVWIFLLFTIAGTKIDHYILPITVSLAVLVALVWEQYLRPDAPFWIRPALVLSVGFLYLPVRDFIAESSRYLMDVFTTERSIRQSDTDQALWIMFFAWVIVMVLAAFRKRSRVIVTLAMVVAFGNAVYFSHSVVPTEAKYRSLKLYTDYYESVLDPGAELIYFGDRRYSMHYYYGKENYRRFKTSEVQALGRFCSGKPAVYIIVQKKYRRHLRPALGRFTDDTWYNVFGDDGHPTFSLFSNDTRLAGKGLEEEL